MEQEYFNKVVFITGGSSGMGLLAGQNYAALGAKVMLVARNEEHLKNAKESMAEYGDNVQTCVCDVTDYESVVNARDAAVRTFGRIDILINFAGGAENRLKKSDDPFWETPIEVFDFGIDLNLKGTFYCCHAVFGQMVKQNSGIIINIGSVSGLEPAPRSLAYNAAKSAVMNGLTPSLAFAGARYNIRCCCVSPGPVLTRESMNFASTLMKRCAKPQEVVDMVMYLTSEKADFITGQNFIIDGGRLLMDDKANGQNNPL